jgi:pyruvate/2-oxoglutarate dehydrogenase complex dihydrolipoamide acyltransferase (E2) component
MWPGPSYRSGRQVTVATVTVLVALAAGACGDSGDKKQDAGVAGPSEVSLEKVSTRTPNPFTAPVGKDHAKIRPPKAVRPGPATFKGSLPGLYGGTRNTTTCDASQLVTYLRDSPDKAAAWAGALGLQTTEIRTYVSGLTAVLLRTDTRVTNHGFVDGRANPIPALLQAGTAVLVDKYGTPVVKCYCGNPLTAAVPLAQPRYVGTPWSGYAPGNITIINSSTTIIQNFRLYDPDTGRTFRRPAGTDGTEDGPYINVVTPPTATTPAQPVTPTTTTPTQPPAPTQTQTQTAPTPPAAPSENPSASFTPVAGTRGDTFTLTASGFAPNTTLAVALTRPDGVLERYSITTDASGSGSHQFEQTGAATPLGTYTAVVRNPETGAQAQASTSVS